MKQIGVYEYVDDEFEAMLAFYMNTPVVHNEEKFTFREKYLSYKVGDEVLMLMFLNDQKQATAKPRNVEKDLEGDIHIMNDPLDAK